MFVTLLAATETDRSDFVDLDVPLWAWLGLLLTIVTMLGVDLYRHRDARAPSTREALTESMRGSPAGCCSRSSLRSGSEVRRSVSTSAAT